RPAYGWCARKQLTVQTMHRPPTRGDDANRYRGSCGRRSAWGVSERVNGLSAPYDVRSEALGAERCLESWRRSAEHDGGAELLRGGERFRPEDDHDCFTQVEVADFTTSVEAPSVPGRRRKARLTSG